MGGHGETPQGLQRARTEIDDIVLPEPKKHEVRVMVADSLANTIDQIIPETQDAERARKLNSIVNDLGKAAIPEEDAEVDEAFASATAALVQLGAMTRDELNALVERTRKVLKGEKVEF